MAILLCGSVANTSPLVHVGRLEIHQLHSRILGATRTIRVWLPPAFPRHGIRYDVLYLNDGQNLFGDGDPDSGGGGWHADEATARLMEQHRIVPLLIVGIDNAGDRARSVDYLPAPDPFSGNDPPGANRYLSFLIHEVMPFVNQRYPTAPGPDHTGFGGSSYGAASALWAAETRPGVFGRLLLESPSVGVGSGMMIGRARTMRTWPRRVDIGIGSEEGRERHGPSKELEELVRILKNAGLGDDRLRFVVQQGGRHNEASWAARLPKALAFLFRPTKGRSR